MLATMFRWICLLCSLHIQQRCACLHGPMKSLLHALRGGRLAGDSVRRSVCIYLLGPFSVGLTCLLYGYLCTPRGQVPCVCIMVPSVWCKIPVDCPRISDIYKPASGRWLGAGSCRLLSSSKPLVWPRAKPRCCTIFQIHLVVTSTSSGKITCQKMVRSIII